MKIDRNKNTLQLLARKSYIHPYILPFPAEFVCVNGLTFYVTFYGGGGGGKKPFTNRWSQDVLIIMERCRDRCRTSAGGCSCSCHFSYFTTILPSL